MYGEKIKMIRELRGFSQEHMANKLDIAQNTYSRIEKNQTKLTAEVLEKISKELGVSPIDILSTEPAIVNFGTVHGTLQGNIENFYTYQKEVIETMKLTLDGLMEQNKILMKFLDGKIERSDNKKGG